MNKFQKFLLPLFIILGACASAPETTSNPSISEDRYEDLVEQYSDHIQQYDGPYNTLEVSATILNSEVIRAQVLRQATLFQWDKDKFETELRNRQENTKNKAEIFVSFYTPDRKSGDLLRADTLWKTILKINSQEIVGTPKKLTLLPVEIKSLYPRHNRWSSGYVITFDRPMASLETQSSELVITGPVGVATLKFEALKANEP